MDEQMQIICPNCGSKSPIEAGSLVAQTRIVCARCAVEFTAELSDEQSVAAPAEPAVEERSIELFSVEAVPPAFLPEPVSVAEDTSSPTADASSTEEAALRLVTDEPLTTESQTPVEVQNTDEEMPFVSESSVPGGSEVYEVLSLPEETPLEKEPVSGSADIDDPSNVLENVFAAWSQSCESKVEADTASQHLAEFDDDRSTSPLVPDYEEVLHEDHEPEVELTASTSPVNSEAETDATSEVSVEEAVRSESDEQEPAVKSFSDEPLPPHVAAAQNFDKYALGTRLMRVSPLWLLVSGLSFISFVVLCNWFFIPANVARADSERSASRRNDATSRPLASAAHMATTRPNSKDNTNHSAQPSQTEAANSPVEAEKPAPAPTEAPATPALTPAPTASPMPEQPKAAEVTQAQSAPSAPFTVQIGSYNTPAEAETRAAALRSAEQSVRVVGVEIPKRGKWYRVYVGGFGSRGEAEAFGKSLRERGLAESYIATEAQ